MGRESSIFGADGGQLKVEDYRCVCVGGGGGVYRERKQYFRC